MKIIDIDFRKTGPAKELSNLASHSFIVREAQCASMEGFLQSLKFKDPVQAAHIQSLTGFKAKFAGKGKDWRTSQTLWFKGEPIKRDSQEYQDLLDDAYVSLFTQDTTAQKALLDTEDAVLKHSMGRSKEAETILTRSEFCTRLTNIRDLLRAKRFVKL